MNNLYINIDGANCQAQAVLAFLRGYDGIENSYDSETHKYLAEPEVNRWHNCREQGYVISLRNKNYSKCLNIVFFEHRNSDQICAVVFELNGINPPTINDIPKNHPYYESKYNYDHSVGYGKACEMADWIQSYMEEWWKTNQF